MNPRTLVLIPLAALAAAVAGALLPSMPVLAVLIGLLLGGGATFVVSRAGDKRLSAELVRVDASVKARYEELAAERARVERLLDALPTAILLFEPGGLSYANPVGQVLFSVRRRESRSLLQILGVQGLAHAVSEARETGRSVDVEVQRADRHLTAHAAATGEDVVALVVTDVTDARRLEAVRRDFVTNASHELKTPVAGMQALADSLGLAIDRDPERARSMIVRVQIEATRLGRLVRELLDLARLEDDDANRTERQRIDMGDIVRVQAERVRGLAEARSVKVRVDIAGEAPIVAVPGDLRLIVANLLENAVRYNRPGGSVDLILQRVGNEVVLEVADTGIGIPEADRDRVFERFYRVDKARSRAAGGTGLGLSIVRHAAERHGGDVTVSSVLGEGSTFRVILPVEGTHSPRP